MRSDNSRTSLRHSVILSPAFNVIPLVLRKNLWDICSPCDSSVYLLRSSLHEGTSLGVLHFLQYIAIYCILYLRAKEKASAGKRFYEYGERLGCTPAGYLTSYHNFVVKRW